MLPKKQWALRHTLARTVMQAPLPPEIFDLVIDHLHDELITLKACCLVSKSWVARSRTHIFAQVTFDPAGSSVGSWMKAFPNPSNSPAHHTRSLRIHNLGTLPANMCAWICSFRHIQELSVDHIGWEEPRGFSYVPLHGLSHTLKSLHLSTSLGTTTTEVMYLVCSFPFLEDLSLHSTHEGDTDRWAVRPTLPKFTGSLRLKGKNRSIIRQLLELPGGLHFSEVRVLCRVLEVDSEAITDLISKCPGTLETLSLEYRASGASALVSTVDRSLTMHPAISMAPSPLDLSNAMKLKYLIFRWSAPGVQWITITLRTARSKTLRRITICLRNALFIPEEGILREWHELDHLLVQLWTSRSILPRILYKHTEEGLVSRLLPELVRKGFTRNQGRIR